MSEMQIQPIDVDWGVVELNGWWFHPALPNFDSDEDFEDWLASLGLEAADHHEQDVFIPTQPAGDGWFIVSLVENDQGASSLWLRYKPASKLNKRPQMRMG